MDQVASEQGDEIDADPLVPDNRRDVVATERLRRRSETAAMLFWALMASGQITMRKVDGWETLAEKPADQTIDPAA